MDIFPTNIPNINNNSKSIKYIASLRAHRILTHLHGSQSVMPLPGQSDDRTTSQSSGLQTHFRAPAARNCITTISPTAYWLATVNIVGEIDEPPPRERVYPFWLWCGRVDEGERICSPHRQAQSNPDGLDWRHCRRLVRLSRFPVEVIPICLIICCRMRST